MLKMSLTDLLEGKKERVKEVEEQLVKEEYSEMII